MNVCRPIYIINLLETIYTDAPYNIRQSNDVIEFQFIVKCTSSQMTISVNKKYKIL